jgi:hypothetical protein
MYEMLIKICEKCRFTLLTWNLDEIEKHLEDLDISEESSDEESSDEESK